MTDPVKTETVTRLGIRWPEDEWNRVLLAMERKNEFDRLHMGPSDFLRHAAKKVCDEILGHTAASAA